MEEEQTQPPEIHNCSRSSSAVESFHSVSDETQLNRRKSQKLFNLMQKKFNIQILSTHKESAAHDSPGRSETKKAASKVKKSSKQ